MQVYYLLLNRTGKFKKKKFIKINNGVLREREII